MMNSQKYLQVLKDKLSIFIEVHTKSSSKTQRPATQLALWNSGLCEDRCPTAGLAWNSPDVNPIENYVPPSWLKAARERYISKWFYVGSVDDPWPP